jgi:hypothetical protein
MMRLAILNPLIPRTPKVGRETSEKKQFSESNFFEKIVFSDFEQNYCTPKICGKMGKVDGNL